ncbi:MAG: hypothetical protein O3A51_01015 [Verrucomicrobia bacterium]|nr:hypothetical protein [Verrucomicrobiota bacterium]
MTPSTSPPDPIEPQLIFNPRTTDLAEFESLARMAREVGFTHLYISQLSERTDFMGADADSPWAEWSNIMPAIFKHVTPPGLEQAYAPDFVQRQMTWMKAKHAICEKLGMRAAYFATEPMWLSDRVYEEHPEWRGSRCDNSLRSSGMHFSPNTDHPEVREAYRSAVAMIVRECPLVDTFVLHSNDCGSGYPWSDRLYVNPNGATGYENRDMGQRVIGFLESIRDGAVTAGATDPHVFISLYGWFAPQETYLVARSLKPGFGCAGVFRSGDPEAVREFSLGSAGAWHAIGGGAGMEPVIRSYPNPHGVLHAATTMRNGPVARFDTGGVAHDYFAALKVAKTIPAAATPTERVQALVSLAEGLYGADVADAVVAAWQTLDRAETMIGVSGAQPYVGCVMLRWLVRPLVSHQERLTPDELAYWNRYIYQNPKTQAETYLDYFNCSGYPIIHGWDDATRIAIAIDSIEATLQDAAMQLKAASEQAQDAVGARRLLLDHFSVRAYRSLFLTIRHVAQVGGLIQIREAEQQKREARGETMSSTSPERPDLAHGNMGSTGLFYLHRALRWELDNTNELIRILEECPEPIFYTAVDEAHEGSLVLGPNLLSDLKRKVRIMLAHWRDAEDGWYRPTLGG